MDEQKVNLVAVVIFGQHSTEYADVTVQVLQEEPGYSYPRGLVDYESELSGVKITASMNRDHPEWKAYGEQVVIEAPFGGMNLKVAERAHKVLSSIDRKTQKMIREWGHPSSFGKYVLYALKAMGIQKVYIAPPEYSGERWADMNWATVTRDLIYAADQIDWTITAKAEGWSEKHWQYTR